MKKISTLLLLLLSHSSFSQNLVSNPSFEQYDTCPNFLTQINYSIGWTSYGSTPDYYNSCAPDTAIVSVSVPSNYYGFQYARTGNAYAAFETFQKGVTNAREYIGTKLNQALIIGRKYFASFWVSRPVSPHPYINVAINKIGIRLSTVAYTANDPEPTDNRAQVFTDSIITDTLNWVQISGLFIADSDYQYLGIGNFFNDSLTSYIRFDSISTAAYYYIDDVYLSADSDDGISTIYKSDFLKLFPNPARDWIVLEGSEIKSFSIFDALGRVCIANTSAITSLLKINVSDLSSGIYFIRINTSNNSFIQKIIIN